MSRLVFPVPGCKPSSDAPAHYPVGYFGRASREVAETALDPAPVGCFLVRESERRPGEYALSMRLSSGIKHFRLYYGDGQHFVAHCLHFPVSMSASTPALEATSGASLSQPQPQSQPQSQPQRTTPVLSVSTGEDSSASTSLISPRATSDAIAMPSSPRSAAVAGAGFGSVGSVSPASSPVFARKVVKAHRFDIHNYKNPTWCDECGDFLWGLRGQGFKCQDCGTNAHKQCSTETATSCTPGRHKIKKVFGADLTLVLAAHQSEVPHIVDKCIVEVQSRGILEQGIYRISGSSSTIRALVDELNTGREDVSVNFEAYPDVHVVAGVLKMYLRQLPDPVISTDAYPAFIASVRDNEKDEDKQLVALSAQVASLAPAHFNVLRRIILHLADIAAHADENRMPATNLAVVFGPTLMRASDEAGMPLVADTLVQNKAVQLLIENADTIFPSA